MFCSEICLQEAMEFFHLRESELIDVMNELDLTKSEWNAAFRAILRQPLSYFLEHRKEIFTKFDNKYGVELEKGETYMSDDYKAMVNLVSRLRLPISLLQYSDGHYDFSGNFRRNLVHSKASL